MPGRHYRPEAVRSEQRIARVARISRTGLFAALSATAVGLGVAHLLPATGPSTPRRDTPTVRAAAAPNADPTTTAPYAATPSLFYSATPTASVSSTAPSATPSSAVEAAQARLTSIPAGQVDEATDIPLVALNAYQDAAAWSAANQPACQLPWQFLAGIGQIETDHGRFGGSELAADGTDTPAVYGPPIRNIRDASGRPVRAAGPMQFIPSTWQQWGSGNPQNINAAALAAAKYLCADGRDLTTKRGRFAAAFSYNHVTWYAIDVEALYQAYLRNTYLTQYPVAAPTPHRKPKKHHTPSPATSSAVPTKPRRTPTPSPTHSPTPTKTAGAPSEPTASATPTPTGMAPTN